jgi:hypothetical protein
MCGCERVNGYVCGSHCQWQGCTRDGQRHTDHCLNGDRIEPYYSCWYDGEKPQRDLSTAHHLVRLERVA